MSRYSLTHVTDEKLDRDLHTVVADERAIVATVLAHLAEFDARKLYLPAAYPSMYEYCVGDLGLSEDCACRRIRAARAAHQVPVLFTGLEQGQLTLSTILILAPYLTPENVDELLKAASRKTNTQTRELLAERYPKPDLPGRVRDLSPPPALACEQPAQDLRGLSAPARMHFQPLTGAETAEASSSPLARNLAPWATIVTPLGPERFGYQFTLEKSAHEDFRYAQALLSHQIPPGDVSQVFARALKALIPELERGKFAATDKPRQASARPSQTDTERPTEDRERASTNPRHVPAEVKRTVWQRDGGQCTFTSPIGRRCQARTLLEFDHIDPVARGGQATVEGMRLRCRAHNQYTAEQEFGTEFMNGKREEAKLASAQARATRTTQATRSTRAAQATQATQATRPAATARQSLDEGPDERADREESHELTAQGESGGSQAELERQAAEAAKQRAELARQRVEQWEKQQVVIACLRRLGVRATDARYAAAQYCDPNKSVEDQIRAALSRFAAPHRRISFAKTPSDVDAGSVAGRGVDAPALAALA